MYKQAYLVIAHKYDFTFKTLMLMLDRTENDIFVHMDIKNKNFDENECRNYIHKAQIYFVQRRRVTWGGYSQIKAEMSLLKYATSINGYNYYHLISGEDLPIQTGEAIASFFQRNQGKEFVAFEKECFMYDDRVRYFYPLQEYVGRNNKKVLGRIAAFLAIVQKILHIHRNMNIRFQKGSQWFSITDSLARYVVSKENWIEKVFSNTICCDEVFLQTLIINSSFKEKVFSFMDKMAIMRLIDWNRGTPYVYRIADIKELKNSNMMFARKFDAEFDSDIINIVRGLYT